MIEQSLKHIEKTLYAKRLLNTVGSSENVPTQKKQTNYHANY